MLRGKKWGECCPTVITENRSPFTCRSLAWFAMSAKFEYTILSVYDQYNNKTDADVKIKDGSTKDLGKILLK